MSDETNQPLNSGVFPDVQASVRDRLASFSEFGGLAMILQYEGSIDTKIDEALAVMTDGFRVGAALLIATPAAEENAPNLATVRLDPFGVTVTVVEDTVLNAPPDGTGRRALEWAVLALRALKGWTPPGCTKPLTPWGRTLALGPSKGARVIWNLTLRTKVELAPLRQPGEYGYTNTVPPPARL
jgi:hypothetical protein